MPSEVSTADWYVITPGMAWNAAISEADEAAVLKYIWAEKLSGLSWRVMKSSMPLIVFTSSMLLAQGKISDFQWKYRLLVISGADESLVGLLEKEEAGLEERDLKVFILNGSGEKEYAAKPELAEEFTERLSPPDEKPMVYLIGKDGRTTLEWPLADFTFAKLYGKIDAMPMRRREMREGKK